MAGESLNHGIICTNLVSALGAQLRGTLSAAVQGYEGAQ